MSRGVALAVLVADAAKRYYCCLGTRNCFRRLCQHPSSRCLLFTADAQHSLEDPALVWGRQNPAVAQSCLDIPDYESPFDDRAYRSLDTYGHTTNNSSSSRNQKNWDDFLHWRRWKFPILDPPALQYGKALVSHVLTAPLTVAAASPKLIRPYDGEARGRRVAGTSSIGDGKQQQHQSLGRRKLRWCCLGARSEASLPVAYWRELLLLLHRNDNNEDMRSLDIDMDFCGPDMEGLHRPSVRLEAAGSSLSLHWRFRGKFHDYHREMLATGIVLSYDAFLLFNPGVGHPNLQRDWKPTLDHIFSPCRREKTDDGGFPRDDDNNDEDDNGNNKDNADPDLFAPAVSLTAHSARDAARDAAYLQETCGISVDYVENPFASRIRYLDPLENDHIVRPNHFVAIV
jgi:hypothetical protein